MKVRCNICENELNGFCKVKKISVKVNKKRTCEAYIYKESKVKAKQDIPKIRISYSEQQDIRKKQKEAIKQLRAALKEGQRQGTARDLGLIQPEAAEDSSIIQPGDPRFAMPGKDMKHPLTGDLSRFTTTVSNPDKE